MNRHTRRILQKKLGEDFPLEQFLALAGYYNKMFELDYTDFMIFLLKKWVPLHYAELDASGAFRDVEDEQ